MAGESTEKSFHCIQEVREGYEAQGSPVTPEPATGPHILKFPPPPSAPPRELSLPSKATQTPAAMPLEATWFIRGREVEATVCQHLTVASRKMNKNRMRRNPGRVICDTGGIRMFWEKKIENHEKQQQTEDMRVRGSALNKLREEWTQRLERRQKMTQSLQEALEQPSLPPAGPFHTQDKTAA